MLPSEDENAACVPRASVLIPSTWVFFSSKSALEIRNEETWCVQPPVKEKMWKDSRTFFCPLYWLKVTLSPVWAGRVKSGAACPTSTMGNMPP
jgi:hypothetical protein